ncbi:MAG: hypothetical protein RL701_206, partial [Pseudomonadota bacterium]
MPTALLLGVGAVLWMQVTEMKDLADWVDHTDQVIASVYEVQRDVSSQEAAVRGYLLTSDRVLLEGYTSSDPGRGLTTLRTFVEDNPTQLLRVDEATRRYDHWRQLTDPLLAAEADLRPFKTLAAIQARRDLTNGIRALMVEMLRVEQELRHERSEAAHAANTSG